MDGVEARKLIERATAWDKRPTLTVGEVDDLVLYARRPDADGREPTELDWIETYDVRAGARLGWEWKLAKVVGEYDVSADGATFDKASASERIKEMIERYGGGGSGSKTLTSIRTDTGHGLVDPAFLYPDQIP